MKFKNFYCALHKLGRFSEEELKKIESCLKVVLLKKNAFLFTEGKTCQSIYFIEKGSLRLFYVNQLGDDITINLFLETGWAFDYQSLTSQKPTLYYLQATEDSELLELNIYDLHRLIKESDSYFQLMRILKIATETPESSPEKLSPKEKYIELINNKPNVVEKFQLKHIASYLRITPETLSRIRQSFSQT
jgi:CRP-like cAMP-binding protein